MDSDWAPRQVGPRPSSESECGLQFARLLQCRPKVAGSNGEIHDVLVVRCYVASTIKLIRKIDEEELIPVWHAMQCRSMPRRLDSTNLAHLPSLDDLGIRQMVASMRHGQLLVG